MHHPIKCDARIPVPACFSTRRHGLLRSVFHPEHSRERHLQPSLRNPSGDAESIRRVGERHVVGVGRQTLNEFQTITAHDVVFTYGLYADSVVALRGSSGKLVWHYQIIHHNIWDYDLPAQPSLITVRKDGRDIPAIAQATKMQAVGQLAVPAGLSGPFGPQEQ